MTVVEELTGLMHSRKVWQDGKAESSISPQVPCVKVLQNVVNFTRDGATEVEKIIKELNFLLTSACRVFALAGRHTEAKVKAKIHFSQQMEIQVSLSLSEIIKGFVEAGLALFGVIKSSRWPVSREEYRRQCV
ncbi:hypothetical protein CDAR_442321 [Caerostris darwini]|uniref:Uncharacterized protein n=1 Tax=Caerostris darwini TaxID=1538125 RepID=A0AAV4V114_9ARAC|nr:hypothetical protein CDAR_442321 [Caerostris darwini]